LLGFELWILFEQMHVWNRLDVKYCCFTEIQQLQFELSCQSCHLTSRVKGSVKLQLVDSFSLKVTSLNRNLLAVLDNVKNDNAGVKL